MLLPAIAGATKVKRMELKELVTVSDRVVVGTVQSSFVSYNPETGRVYTYTTLLVSEHLKGEETRNVTIRQYGGEVDGKTLWIPGVPKLNEGMEYVLFLSKRGDFHIVRGLGQGAFSISENNGQKVATQMTQSLGIVDSNNQTGIVKNMTIQPARLLLSELQQTIRSLIHLLKTEMGGVK